MSFVDNHPGTACVAVFFGIWLVLSILHQFSNAAGRWVRAKNVYSLIPGYTFFAPNPGTSNYRFVYRDVFPERNYGDWREVEWCSQRSLTDALWNPSRHRIKLVVDCLNGLGTTVKEMHKLGLDPDEKPAIWVSSTPYLVLLHIVMSEPGRHEKSVGRQFAVVEQHPFAPDDPPQLIVCSAAHDF